MANPSYLFRDMVSMISVNSLISQFVFLIYLRFVFLPCDSI